MSLPPTDAPLFRIRLASGGPPAIPFVLVYLARPLGEAA